VFKHVAAMPDVHWGIGATVGSVIPTLKAIIPAAVGVDIGCGMMACKTTLTAERPARQPGAAARGHRARGAARPHAQGAARPRALGQSPARWTRPGPQLGAEFDELCRDYPRWPRTNNRKHLGTLGTGNHFIEVCLDERARVVHAALGLARRGQRHRHALHRAGQEGRRAHQRNLPDQDLAYFEEGSAVLRRLRARGGLGAEVCAPTAR
jgi:tRNA-splicing ligase RtcB